MNARTGRPRVPIPLAAAAHPAHPADPCHTGADSARNMYSMAAAWIRCGAQYPPASARKPLTCASRATR